MNVTKAILALAVSALAPQIVWADKNSELKPALASLGKLLTAESFEGELPKDAKTAKGSWQIVEGVLHGEELAEDKHAAVLSYGGPNHNSVVRFSFRLSDDTKGFHFSLNKARGHLFRIIVTPSKLAVSLDKDKRDPTSKPKSLGEAKQDFPQDVWITMQVEMLGDKVVVQTDNGVSVTATHPTLDIEKPNYRFVMRGSSLELDDVQVWEAE